MDLKLNLTKVISEFKLFKTVNEILDGKGDIKGYNQRNPQSFDNSASRSPELFDFLNVYTQESGSDESKIDVYLANLIYNQRGSYKSIDLLSKVLGVEIKLFNGDTLLNNPEFLEGDEFKDKNPIRITKVTYSRLTLHKFFAFKLKFIPVLRTLVWLLEPDLDIEAIEVVAEIELEQEGQVFGGCNLIRSIIISEVES